MDVFTQVGSGNLMEGLYLEVGRGEGKTLKGLLLNLNIKGSDRGRNIKSLD